VVTVLPLKVLPLLDRYAEAFSVSGGTYNVEPEILAAIAWRESMFGLALDTFGLGDHGFGHGLMQIDKRSFPAWCAEWSKTWLSTMKVGSGISDSQDAQQELQCLCIDKGAVVFNDKRRYIIAHVPSLAKKPPNCREVVVPTLAAYNCGEGRVVKLLLATKAEPSLATEPITDSLTTGKDYGRDTWARTQAVMTYWNRK
jgi:hypothetical protein